jgi:hypothetical protein
MPRYDTFIVRIWSVENHAIHGRIRHIGSLAECDFRDLERMLQFVRESLRRSNESGESGNTGPGNVPEVNWESWEEG